MQAQATLLDRVVFTAAFALALALSWPGIEVHAESGLAPSSRELTSLGAAPAPAARAAAATGDSCAAADPALVAKEYDAQRAMMQRLAQAMEAEDAGEFQALDGRGYGYFAERNPAIELARLQREAQLQERAQAAEDAAKR